MERVYGWAEFGNSNVLTNGVPSQNNTLVQRSFPGATVTVYVSGTNNTANLYSDNSGTPLGNPFNAANNGYWDFYAAAGRYDVQFSGANIVTPFILPDILVASIQSINNQTGENITLVVGANGSNFNIAANNNNITLNLPRANANNSGYLAAADWANFNAATSYNFSAPLVNNNGNVMITLPITLAQGGTNSNNKVQAFNTLTPQANKGDLIAFNGNNAVRFPSGNNNDVLIVDGSNNNGWRWGPAPAGNLNGVVPVASGGTGGNNATQGFDNLSPITTKGDLIAGNNNNIAVRVPVGSDNQVLTANSANANGMVWGPVNLAGNGIAGVLPSASGGTGGNNNAQGFNLLSPMTANGDLITRAANNATRLGIGNQNDVLTVNNNNAAIWQQPVTVRGNFTVAFNNNAFTANSNSVQITLFTLGQFQKAHGFTVKPATLFLNANNTITDVQVAIGIGGNANFYSNAYSIGNNGAVGNSNFQDTPMFRSANMGANTPVIATFTANNGNFGNGAATVLLSGSVTIWVIADNLQ